MTSHETICFLNTGDIVARVRIFVYFTRSSRRLPLPWMNHEGLAVNDHGGSRTFAVRPTLEVVLTETPAYLRRRFDQQSGLALIDPDIRA
jgi:hypothetical protein